MLQQFQQMRADKVNGLLYIGVRRFTITADDGGALYIFPAQVAVGVTHYRNGQVGAYDAAYFL